ncbi:MAG: hypothetical protein M3Z00_11825 [Actinomycetota bacterium]|nr:hypothetical protein [Actinomycetota bacterium]
MPEYSQTDAAASDSAAPQNAQRPPDRITKYILYGFLTLTGWLLSIPVLELHSLTDAGTNHYQTADRWQEGLALGCLAGAMAFFAAAAVKATQIRKGLLAMGVTGLSRLHLLLLRHVRWGADVTIVTALALTSSRPELACGHGDLVTHRATLVHRVNRSGARRSG